MPNLVFSLTVDPPRRTGLFSSFFRGQAQSLEQVPLEILKEFFGVTFPLEKCLIWRKVVNHSRCEAYMTETDCFYLWGLSRNDMRHTYMNYNDILSDFHIKLLLHFHFYSWYYLLIWKSVVSDSIPKKHARLPRRPKAKKKKKKANSDNVAAGKCGAAAPATSDWLNRLAAGHLKR